MNYLKKKKRSWRMAVRKNNFGDAVFKCRGIVWGVFTLIALIFPYEYNFSRFILGSFFLVAGQAFRFWAAGYIPNYRTSTIGAPKLVVWGPYKWIRNPLYLGNFVMGLGWTLMLGWLCVLAFSVAFLTLYMLIVIPAEEKFLESKFGEAYLEYKKNVPSFFPLKLVPFRNDGTDEVGFNRDVAWTGEVYSLRMNILISVAVLFKLFLVK